MAVDPFAPFQTNPFGLVTRGGGTSPIGALAGSYGALPPAEIQSALFNQAAPTYEAMLGGGNGAGLLGAGGPAAAAGGATLQNVNGARAVLPFAPNTIPTASAATMGLGGFGGTGGAAASPAATMLAGAAPAVEGSALARLLAGGPKMPSLGGAGGAGLSRGALMGAGRAAGPWVAGAAALNMIGNPLLDAAGVQGNNKVRQVSMDAGTGGLLGGGAAAALGSLGLVSGPVGWGIMGAGALGGGLYGLLHEGPTFNEDEARGQIGGLYDQLNLDQIGRQSVDAQYASALAQVPDASVTDKKKILAAVLAMIPQERTAQVERDVQAQQFAGQMHMLESIMGPAAEDTRGRADEARQLELADAQAVGGAQGKYLTAIANRRYGDARQLADAYQMQAYATPLLQLLAQYGNFQNKAQSRADTQALNGSGADLSGMFATQP